jgi:hypothetical protein
MMASVAALEIAAITINGKPMPMPKDTKRAIFTAKSIPVAVVVKRTAINAGLHGITIAPKKNPYVKAFAQGFLAIGARPGRTGRILSMSTSKSKINDKRLVTIRKRLIISSMPKAIGEAILITLVRDTSRMVVNTKPSKNIKIITPAVITSPNRKMVSLPASFPDSWLERYTRNPG